MMFCTGQEIVKISCEIIRKVLSRCCTCSSLSILLLLLLPLCLPAADFNYRKTSNTVRHRI